MVSSDGMYLPTCHMYGRRELDLTSCYRWLYNKYVVVDLAIINKLRELRWRFQNQKDDICMHNCLV